MCSSTCTSNSTYLFLTTSHRRIIWSITSSQLFAKRRPVHRFIFVSKRKTHPTHGIPHTREHNIPSLSHRGTTQPAHGIPHPTQGTQPSISVSGRNHTPNSWDSSPHIGAHNFPSLSQRGTTHPTHGISLRTNHSVCVLEDVSCSCNHQHSLSSREAFSIRPSITRKYLNFVFSIVINTPSQLGMYSPPSQFLTEVLELRIGKRFGENICNLLMCRKVLHVYLFPQQHVF
jgi:hypothetical protein